MAPNLSYETQRRVDMMYPPDQREEVTRLLVEECGQDPLSTSDHEGIERIRFAALKVSNGDVDVLKKAIKLAQSDWRDLFMAAGFGNNPSEHKSWLPKGMGPQQE